MATIFSSPASGLCLKVSPCLGPSASHSRQLNFNFSSERKLGWGIRSARPLRRQQYPRAPRSSIATVDTFPIPAYEEHSDEDSYEVPVHTVRVHDRQRDVWHEFEVPEDQYILQTAEEQGIELPFSCRHGCCTACSVRVKGGELLQPRALGISPELKQQGYALLCVGIPKSDLEVETQDEDEVYWLQFGRYFAKGPVERDDYALELAVADE